MELRKVFGLVAIASYVASLAVGAVNPDLPEDGISGEKEPMSTAQKAKKGFSGLCLATTLAVVYYPRKEDDPEIVDDNDQDLPEEDGPAPPFV